MLMYFNKTHLKPGQILLLSYIHCAKDPSRPPVEIDVHKFLLYVTLVLMRVETVGNLRKDGNICRRPMQIGEKVRKNTNW